PIFESAIALAGEHLSVYQLTIETGTAFAPAHARGDFVLPDEETQAALYETTVARLEAAGLLAYEISNHARPGTECRHNLVYWRYHEYVGVGPGAHGRVVVDGKRHATSTERRPESWLMRVEANGHGIVSDEVLTRAEQADEYLLMGLRLAEGIDPLRYAAFSGHPLDAARIATLGAEGMIESSPDGRLRVTRAGFPVL